LDHWLAWASSALRPLVGSGPPGLAPAIERSGGNVDRAIAANAQFQAELLRTSSTMIRDALEQRKIDVRSAAYELASGKVMML
jgi:carbonic anhydrase